MKGAIFTELLAMAEERGGKEVVDRVIETAGQPSGDACIAEAVESAIHAEVHRLYSDAAWPRFDTRHKGAASFDMTYRSPRPLADFRHGLTEDCAAHSGETARISRRDGTEGPPERARCHIEAGTDP